MNCDLQILLPKCREMFARDDDIEAVLGFLRQRGCSKLDSIEALMKLKGLDVASAKRTVHLCKTWDDTRRQDEEFETAFWEELIRLTKSEDE